MANKRKKLVRILAWLALGPITGILGWRMHVSIQARHRFLAILYGAAILATSAALVSGLDGSVFVW